MEHVMWICGKKEQAEEEGWKVGSKEEGSISNPSRTSGLCLGITRHPCDNPHAFNDLCDNQSLLKSVKRWVSEGGKATLVGAPDADILLEAIEELRKRATAATFLVTLKMHWREPANEEANIPEGMKQTRLFQANMFPWNSTTRKIEQSSHGKGLTGKNVQWAMKIESRRGTAACGRWIDEDQQKSRCANTGIVWQELGNISANNDNELM